MDPKLRNKLIITWSHYKVVLILKQLECVFCRLFSRVDDNKHQRFAKAFNASSARMVTIKNNIFVLLNSMAFEGDGCAFCQEAEDSLNRIIRSLDCAQVCNELVRVGLDYLIVYWTVYIAPFNRSQ